VDRIRDLRRSASAAFPLLDWQFVVMGHNEHEIGVARAMAQARGMHFMPRLSWSADCSPVVDRDLVRIETGLGAASREEFRENKGIEYTRDLCSQLWHAPVINWDGRMLGCCVNYWGDFGANVFEEGLDAAMRHAKLEYARRMLLGEAEPRPGIPCTTCDQYRAMAGSGNWLREEELRTSAYGKLLAGLVPVADAGCRFARISIVQGLASKPRFDISGRLFRFGIDSGIYFHAPDVGLYTVFTQCLEADGWGKPSRHLLEIGASPLCQEFRIDAREGLDWRLEADSVSTPGFTLSHWIR
jgi:hypothetical protein